MFLCHCCVEVLTPVAGQPTQAEKYQRGDFGQCPRVLCNFAKLAPVAVSDKTDVACVQTYCPSCREIYKPANRKHMSLDGAYFGTSFAHILFMVHPALLPAKITADTKYARRLHLAVLAPSRKGLASFKFLRRISCETRSRIWVVVKYPGQLEPLFLRDPGVHGNPPPNILPQVRAQDIWLQGAQISGRARQLTQY
jgi:hypothetical protein